MKKLNFVKFGLDLAMGIIFALLLNHRILGGMIFHEIAGMAVGGAVLIHLLFNAKWVKNMTRALFIKKTTLRAKLGYVLNLLLLLDLIVILVSGILTSKVLFPNLAIHNDFFSKSTHVAAAYAGLGLIGLHVGLHWTWVMNVFKKITRRKAFPKAAGYAATVVALLVLAYGTYNIVSVDYVQNVSSLFGQSTYAVDEHLGQGGGNAGNNQDAGAGENGNGASHGSGNGASGSGGASNVGQVLATYLSIMGAFAAYTYYFEKLIRRRNGRFGGGSPQLSAG